MTTLLLALTLIASEPRAFLVAQYVDGNARVCEYSDGSVYRIARTSRCAAVLY